MGQRTCAADDCELDADQCGLCWMHYARMRKHGSLDLVTLFVCIDCSGSFPRSGTRGPVPKRYKDCTRKRWSEKYKPGAKRRLTGNVECIVCGGDAPIGTRYCSGNCRSLRGGSSRPKTRECTRCGIEFSLIERTESGRLPPLYTATCKECRRPNRYELTALQVAERDGSSCALCGETVDFSIKAPHNLSPSVDHIIPWAQGGTSGANNLQLAHRICNVRKGVRMEQRR